MQLHAARAKEVDMVVALLIGVALGATVHEGTWTAGAQLAEMEVAAREAVNVAVAPLGFLKRPIARMVLVRATAPCAELRIQRAYGSEALSITCDDKKSAIAPPDGAAVRFIGRDGRSMDLTHAIDGTGALVQTFANARGTRTNRMVFQPDGGLTMEVTIDAAVLDSALHYAIKYSGQ
ncbi:MAG: hypothetical protein ACI8PZ_006638 [Myxococcota bacterium]